MKGRVSTLKKYSVCTEYVKCADAQIMILASTQAGECAGGLMKHMSSAAIVRILRLPTTLKHPIVLILMECQVIALTLMKNAGTVQICTGMKMYVC